MTADDDFLQFERKLAEAYLHGDRAFVDGLLADDWTSTDYRGRSWTKPDVLALFEPGGPTFSAMKIDVDHVRRLGDVVVVTGRSVSSGRVQDRDLTIIQRYTDVYVKRDGRWRIVTSHGTQIQ
ncbi:MAG: nuclear transport factor 2 family protein [Acidobacteria bacterium]|nr:nuclear transport factor 2 family protein [Acidobacteriota bacterium]